MKANRIFLIALAALALFAVTSLRASAKPLGSTITVTNNLDETTNGDGCSLREAITNANNNAATFGDCAAGSGTDTIAFNIRSGTQTIQPSSGLPPITDPAMFDGTTQPGCATYPCIVLDGSVCSRPNDGLGIAAGNSTVKGLVINQFDNGIRLDTNGGNTIIGNYIGTDVGGTASLGNFDGVYIVDSDNNTIGGTSAGARNLISGNVDGIDIYVAAGGNLIEGNYIGTDASGTASLGNGADGIASSSDGNTIGGTSAGARNLISGNGFNGVYIRPLA